MVDVEVGKVIVISLIVVKLNSEKSCSYKKMSNGSKDMLSTSLKWFLQVLYKQVRYLIDL